MILKGSSVASGIAVGKAFVYKEDIFQPKASFVPKGTEQVQVDKYLLVKQKAYNELEKIKLAAQKHDPAKAEIFSAHQEIIEDIVINEEIPAKILNEHWAGDWAIYQVYETIYDTLKHTADPLISERAADFNDVRNLLLKLWYGKKNEELPALPEAVIVAALELSPSYLASIDKEKVLAFITENGGLTSHSAILAKSFEIPAVFGINGLLDNIKHGQTLAVNADEGFVILDPDEKTAAEYKNKRENFLANKKETEAYLKKEGRTSCGVKIDIGLNISNADSDLSAAEYVDSVGLFRTEFLYMGRSSLPSEDEQFSVYKKTLECFGKRPVILRTIDIGGDKPVSSMQLPKEENPFLGNRALRLCFTYPEIFITQIKAALRAAVYGNLWLMLPMVGSLEDIRKAKSYITAAADELKKEGKAFGDFKTGIMIEIPSIALIAEHAAKEADFASIGSNDLCQYLCAADRQNSVVEDYYQTFHPALFKLIKQTVSAFEKYGKPVSICGEIASNPAAAPLLIGLGLRKLSMGAASIAAVKRKLASVTINQAEEIAKKVLECAAASDVKKLLH